MLVQDDDIIITYEDIFHIDYQHLVIIFWYCR